MRTSPLAGLTALALASGTLLTGSPAQAAGPATLYVAQSSTTCSDAGPGTPEKPYCTIGAAAAVVQAGQSVEIGPGTYPEQVTVPQSGAPGRPITFQTSGSPLLGGPKAGFIIDGQHDITLRGLRLSGTLNGPALDIRNAAAVSIEQVSIRMNAAAAAPAISLAGVTGARISRAGLSAPELVVQADTATSAVTVSSSNFSNTSDDNVGDNVGIEIAGAGTALLSNTFWGYSGAAVSIESSASETVVANNDIYEGGGHGIRVRGAAGTAVSNNTVRGRCRDGIRVEGSSTGTSVQNNVLLLNGNSGPHRCDSAVNGVEIGVYDDAVKGTIVDYNNAYQGSSPSINYSWGGRRMILAAFRTATGQAAHDRDTQDPRNNYDSANSAAPGYQTTDMVGTARADDPAVPNTGAGPVTYADRGATETFRNPVARFETALDLGSLSATVDASTSVPGFVPINSYRIDFGDGTVATQASPRAIHRYATPGAYEISVRVTGSDGRTNVLSTPVSVLRRISTISLLARPNLRYVAPVAPGLRLQANRYGVDSVDTFDLADAGSGAVALYSRSNRAYVAANDGTSPMSVRSTAVRQWETFLRVRNGDGTLSLLSQSSNRYVSTSGSGGTLYANAARIGRFEQFHDVTIGNANRTFRARVNARYVTASGTAAAPLIASATGVGVAQKYDLVSLGNYQWALFARANNRFVTADALGTKPLINNKVTPGTWEKFTLIRNSDGSVSLRSTGNNRYISADKAGTKSLIANRTTIGLWEKFTLG
ncbi:right-handed parallel beta-helix repeat-containing protein [Micromonospora sp. NPDC050686]|uniref:right-handed parallel beta-helix repeat-containing protein n=1 Tax=Micromonospora sp. NPDC050686 TaxID=3154631 RepID=UPI00340AA0AE